MEASSVAKITGDRHGDSSAGQRAPAEPLTAISTLPSESALLELVLHMLTGGSGESAAPAEHYEPAEATLELLVLIWSVVATLKKQHAGVGALQSAARASHGAPRQGQQLEAQFRALEGLHAEAARNERRRRRLRAANAAGAGREVAARWKYRNNPIVDREKVRAFVRHASRLHPALT